MDLLEWVLVISDHDLGPHKTKELDEGVHVAQPDMPEWTVLGAHLVSDVEMERVLEKRC